MSYCCDVLFISALACQIADCLNDDELSLLAADTLLLSDSLNAIAVRRSICSSSANDKSSSNTSSDHADNTDGKS
ncbi:DUF6774 domain-containing protein [Lacrimispora celerecrescens]|uniref:DUF6774 domain-containing protein n=1 Tax=[Clostridium] celerecrescens 18A TaxID=1286362 RepID=A0A2M8Z355_9FIRM|nr:DUF6774 domain-containing protein [Lacrimispora celerecrescens]PJJ27850.1 hypothetical protein H171_1330 [[Clostridium] celerecrescens 18A]